MPPKFGLIKMQGFAKGKGLKAAAPALKAKPVLKAASALGFGAGDSDEEGGTSDEIAIAKERSRSAARGVDVRGVNADLLRQQAASSQKVAKLQAQAVADAGQDVFAYDEVYDDMVAAKGDKHDARRRDFDPSSGYERKESRYIDQLKKAADIRKVDEERIFQMKLKKEADAEAHIYGDKEKFVTAAYKEKLAEMGRWKAEDARLQALEHATTVEGKKSMTGFYANLLTKNLSMGTGDVAKDATSAYTIGSARNDHIRALEGRTPDAAQRNNAATGDADNEPFDEDALLRRTEAAAAAAANSGAANSAGSGADRAEGGGRKRSRAETEDWDKTEASGGGGEGDAAAAAAEASERTEAGSLAVETPEEAAARAAAAVAAQQAAREAAVASAKERFLARKLAKKSQG